MLHRLNVLFPSPEGIIDASDQQHAAEHHHAPVHVFHGGGVDDGEETCDAGDGYVEDCECVDWDAEFAEREAAGWEGFAFDAFLEDTWGLVSGVR